MNAFPLPPEVMFLSWKYIPIPDRVLMQTLFLQVATAIDKTHGDKVDENDFFEGRSTDQVDSGESVEF